ncbi:MAG: HAMP domain-containing histidine kinase [Bacilli bacterium]|nr:HAMP domain-containing histidine kinase [Bacilli bacterium]
MNLFQIIFLDVVLLIFPILVYLLYLTTNKNITKKSKKVYLSLVLITSFFMLYNYGVDTPRLLPVLILNSIVILSYLEDRYIIANILSILIIFIYSNFFNYTFILFAIYILISLLYLIRKRINLKNILFVNLSIIISSIVYFIWVYKYNNEFFNLDVIIYIIICYFFIVNLISFMYETGKKILETHLTYKELQQEKQIRLTLFKITHEIKNPIAVCKGYLDMINVKDTDQVERYVPIIKSEIERLLTILQDFLLINRDNLDLDIMDFNMLIEDTIHKLNPLLKDNNINLNLNILDDEIFINGDYNRLSQVLINIIKNSIEAIPENHKGKIKIKTKIKDKKYYLVVEDNGIGMDKEVLTNIKKPFYTTKKRGSGLGVSLIYEIVEAHNGKIEYSSEYGKGTKVTIQLPIYE